MKVIIDRFEGEFAVVETENKSMVNLPRILVPNAKEGDIIHIMIDKDASRKRKIELDKSVNEIWAD